MIKNIYSGDLHAEYLTFIITSPHDIQSCLKQKGYKHWSTELATTQADNI